jgi:hypothetical protein
MHLIVALLHRRAQPAGAAARDCDRARSARCLTGGVAAVGSAALYGAAVFRLPT